ncbi:hypothetical protein FM109_05330 [Vibrio casei]|nr:hypothetical protein FM109_05330 [Vibrio casei]
MNLEKYGYLTIEQAEQVCAAAELLGRDVFSALEEYVEGV